MKNLDISYNIANLPKEALRNIIVDDKLRILYCSVPGVASSSFRQLFHDKGGALIQPKKNSSNLDSFKRLHQYPPPQRQYMIRNFFKVCERFYSTLTHFYDIQKDNYVHLKWHNC